MLAEEIRQEDVVMSIQDLRLWYGETQALHGISLAVRRHQVLAIIGPSGCGKSTLLRSLNRMHDLTPGVRIAGSVLFNGTDVYGENQDEAVIRHRIGMVFQKPNPFPKSIFDNVAFGPRINSFKGSLTERVEKSLRQAALWDEVQARLRESAYSLSGGQQQRLCIARALALQPEILLMDEPTASLDPAATARIEELITRLKKDYTIIIVTHNMQQAARISDETAFLLNGELIEMRETTQIFTRPRDARTEDYITGRFG